MENDPEVFSAAKLVKEYEGFRWLMLQDRLIVVVPPEHYQVHVYHQQWAAKSDVDNGFTAVSTTSANGKHPVPMVSMDGEAHPEITLTAVGLGVVVACIILITLIALISRRKRHFSHNIGTSSRQFDLSPKLPDSTEIFTITKPVESHSCRICRSSTVTIDPDIVTQI